MSPSEALRPCLLTLALLATRPAAAQAPAASPQEASSNDPRVAEARAAFREGTSLARQAQWGEALLAFERSASLRPHTFTTYNIAYCERALGRYTRARKLLAKALAENDARGGTALSADVTSDAKKYLSEIDARLARATVSLDPPDASLSVDGRPLETVDAARTLPLLAAGTRELGLGEVPFSARFELLLDPGAHVFTLTKAGSDDVIVTRTFAPGTTSSFELKFPVRVSAAANRAPVTGALSNGTTADVAKPSRLPVYILLGVGAAGIATGSIAGILAIQRKNTLDRNCGDSKAACPSNLSSERDALNTLADVSTIAFSVGVLAGGVGTFLLLSARSTSEKPSTTAAAASKTGLVLRPALGIGSAFLTGTF
ncbi:MAG TPA: tetratricopeptide repeat protein [Polyangiaceae bacterium]